MIITIIVVFYNVNQGGLTRPTDHVVYYFQILESIFIGTDLNKCDILKTSLSNADNVPEITYNQKLLFFRSRIYSRIKYSNKCIRHIKPNTHYNKISK